MKIAGGEKIGSENVSTTIYMLTKDLDFTGVTYNAKRAAFTGVLNGLGHTVSNVTLEGTKTDTGLFYRVAGGTIMNIKFNNIRITSNSSRTGIVASAYGGYFHNIAITNLSIQAAERTGGLIGQVFDGQTALEITRVSLINPIPKLTSQGRIAEGQNQSDLYYISSSAHRVAGIIGFIQAQSTMTGTIEIKVEDCYVESYIWTASHTVSSIVGEFDENGHRASALLRGAEYALSIKNCVSAGVLISTGSSGRIGGMLGYHKALGALTISSCIAIHDMYYSDVKLATSQKNQSPIIGNFNDAANADVSRCYALMEEYNSNYNVTVYTPNDFAIPDLYGNTSFNFRTTWQFIFEDESEETLQRPYLGLRFQEV